MSMIESNDEGKAKGAYLSYLVRLWRAGQEANWMASVEATVTHDRHLFADLEGLFAFLATQTGEFVHADVDE